MHPSGVQFGLSRGLLQLRGEEVKLHPAMSRLRITCRVSCHHAAAGRNFFMRFMTSASLTCVKSK